MLFIFGIFLGFFLGFVVVWALGRFGFFEFKGTIKVLRGGLVVGGEVPEGLSAEPFRLFRLLQRESRFLDFIMEDMGGYSDELVAGAVRPVLAKVREVLLDYVSLVPVVGGKEGEDIVVEVGFDADEVRLVGDVCGSAPFRGVLEHHGWRVVGHKIPKAGPGGVGLIIEQAVVCC